ncbi:MAG: hypothetical protein PHD29_04850 [bacterium]|nr:hypothetical protein [bacterium]MDD5757132.1 hypothetical protein [bacterium]
MTNISKIISKLALLPLYILINLYHMFKTLPKSSKNILFVLDDKKLYDDGRYAYLTIRNFSEAGYSIFVYKKVNFLAFTRLGRYGRYIYTIKNVKVISKIPAKTKEIIFAFDSVNKELLSQQWKKLTYVNIMKPSFCQVGELMAIPFIMHPVMYYLSKHRRLPALRGNERKLRIFFGGNTSPAVYSNPIMKLQGHLTRTEALGALMSSCQSIKYIESIKDLRKIMTSNKYLGEGRIWRADWNNKTSSKVLVHKWLETISHSDFFLCFSGTDFPMCHNAIESMAVGTIPIIAYHDWFTPSLEHGKNAIVFSGTDDLVRKVNEVLSMSAAEISEMRQNVIKYYEEHLNPLSFVRKFEASAKELSTLILYPKMVFSEYDIKQGKILLDELNNNLKKYLP